MQVVKIKSLQRSEIIQLGEILLCVRAAYINEQKPFIPV